MAPSVPCLSFVLLLFIGFARGSSTLHPQLAVPPVLNTTAAANVKVLCWTQPPHLRPRLPSIDDVAECYIAQQYTLVGDRVMTKLLFSTDPSRGYEVPMNWAVNSCIIIVAAVGGQPSPSAPPVEDYFQLVLVAHAAATIMHECITSMPVSSLGGQATIGDAQVFEVIVAGRLEDSKEVLTPDGKLIDLRSPLISHLASH